ncbi:unnamed protein product, partial [Amoebophrya sp. A120]
QSYADKNSAGEKRSSSPLMSRAPSGLDVDGEPSLGRVLCIAAAATSTTSSQCLGSSSASSSAPKDKVETQPPLAAAQQYYTPAFFLARGRVTSSATSSAPQASTSSSLSSTAAPQHLGGMAPTFGFPRAEAETATRAGAAAAAAALPVQPRSNNFVSSKSEAEKETNARFRTKLCNDENKQRGGGDVLLEEQELQQVAPVALLNQHPGTTRNGANATASDLQLHAGRDPHQNNSGFSSARPSALFAVGGGGGQESHEGLHRLGTRTITEPDLLAALDPSTAQLSSSDNESEGDDGGHDAGTAGQRKSAKNGRGDEDRDVLARASRSCDELRALIELEADGLEERTNYAGLRLPRQWTGHWMEPDLRPAVLP